jgi:hypothetical protein
MWPSFQQVCSNKGKNDFETADIQHSVVCN